MFKALIWINVIASALLLVPIFYYWYSILFFGVVYTFEQGGVVLAMGGVWAILQLAIIPAIIEQATKRR